MRKIISSIAVLSLFIIASSYNCYAMDNGDENQKSASVENANMESKDIDLNAIVKKSKKAKKNKKIKKVTTFNTVNDSEEKVIGINSVNFIQLKDKAGKVFIPDSKIADVDVIDDQSLLLMGLKPGTTSLIVNDKEGNIIANYKIKVTYQLDEIKAAVNELHPDCSFDLISMDDSVIMKGKVASPDDALDIKKIVENFIEASKIINKLEITTATQVMLKVKIAEISRTVSQTFGLNWRAISFSNKANGLHSGILFGTLGSAFENANNLSTIRDNVTGNLSSGSWFVQSGNGSNNNFAAVINALDEEKFASLIAEPTLVAISGQKATFNAGGEYGYTAKTKSNGETTESIEFKDWGTSLEFTPVVISENRIKITVKPKISSIGSKNSEGTPSVDKKEAETTVELGSGQSLAIAGLLQTSNSANNTRTSGLANLPFIGPLFRNSEVSKEQRESVIIVTPYIVKPSSKGLKAPTDSMTKMYSPVDVVIKGRSHAKAVLSIK